MHTTHFPIRIAFAEDHYFLRETLAKTLEEEAGFSVLIKAENGQVLLQKLVRQRVDLIILDIQMPVLDGYATFRCLKKRHPEIPVVFYSSFSLETVAGELKRIGARHFVEKGGGLEKLVEMIWDVVG